jgi:ElaB/YqjD/DUF883 family membrane-anchored ribosome-binding protein
MDDTRAALSEKLGTLEQRMVDTMHDAADAVAQTVDNVKVAVHDTVVAVHDTVETVKDTFNLHHQVDRHPWAMVGGSIALGFVGGCLLVRHGAAQPAASGSSQRAIADTPPLTAEHNGKGARPTEGASTKADSGQARAAFEPGGSNGSHHSFGTEIAKLKRLAIGTLLSIVRDMITYSAPEPLQARLTEVIDGVTVQLGGEPIRGPVLKMGQTAT